MRVVPQAPSPYRRRNKPLNTSARSSLQRLLTGALLGLLLACPACRSRRTPVRVPGKVFSAKRRATAAVVFFHPVGDAGLKALRPSGRVGADGSFQLTSFRPNDGAPPGDYLVTVVWRSPAKAGDADVSLLPGRYMDPKLSGLKARVQQGVTELEPFQLTR